MDNLADPRTSNLPLHGPSRYTNHVTKLPGKLHSDLRQNVHRVSRNVLKPNRLWGWRGGGGSYDTQHPDAAPLHTTSFYTRAQPFLEMPAKVQSPNTPFHCAGKNTAEF